MLEWNVEMIDINFEQVETPAYILDERLLEKNLKVLRDVMDRTGCRILLAQKGFSMFSEYPLIGKYLSGTTASSLNEARLGRECMLGRETHIFAPAYSEREFQEILETCDHVVFNSIRQWRKFRDRAAAPQPHAVKCGLRVNPGYAEVLHEIYNPCCVGSRFGVSREALDAELARDRNVLDGITGLHFHALCEQNSDTLERVLDAFLEKFGSLLYRMEWVNFGGGHHITREDYDVDRLVRCIDRVKNEYGVQVILEPGEAVALNTGYLVASVMEVQDNVFTLENEGKSVQVTTAILDASAACHMPDVLEMPYRPYIIGSGMPGEKPYNYRFGGNTCLAGDIIGDYSFDEPLEEGTKLVFTDMAHYSMVKNNTFNGINLPSILRYNDQEGLVTVREFGYGDFKGRLG